MAQPLLAKLPTTGRRLRKPSHPFYLEHMPFQIQPFLIAPVLPGETLKNATLQSRVVTDPILNKLIGWWIEYYVFYVKHRDLDERDDFTAMMLDLNYDLSGKNEAAAVAYNHAAGTLNWSKKCLQRVVETFFRDEGVAWDAYTINGMPAAAINRQSWLDSAALGDVAMADEPTIALTGNAQTLGASEVNQMLEMWEFQRFHNLTEMSYEDWLRSFGIRSPAVELHRPELLRYIREWQYPANTIDPADGSASSAVSWAIKDSIDKDRFFREPGFIFGVTVARPKVYLKNLDGHLVDFMNNALTWLPALMRDQPETSLREYADSAGPLATVVTDSDGYWVDHRDLLLYGDEFVNVARSGTGLNMVSLPDAGLTNKDFPTDTDVDGLFVGSADTARQVRQDGIVNFNILGAQVDTTPSNSAGT